MTEYAPPYSHPAPRPEWLALRSEEPLEPDQRIIDAHHHLWDLPGNRYLLDEFLADLDCGHRIEATAFAQCHFAHLDNGPEHLRPIGEVREVVSLAEQARARTSATICTAIIGFADLTGADVGELLALEQRDAMGRLVGIRQSTMRDPNFPNGVASAPPAAGMMGTPAFRRGFARLAETGLAFDAWLYSVQIPELAALADSFGETRIILDHCGGILGVGPYRGRRDAEYALWRERIFDLARRPNVAVKLGGLGMVTSGFGFEGGAVPPSSADLAAAWRPYFETCIEAFGPQRCMFESNFPVDKASTGYGILWNAFKRVAHGCSREEKDLLFFGTAEAIYGLKTP